LGPYSMMNGMLGSICFERVKRAGLARLDSSMLIEAEIDDRMSL
jgi:hypothetical protein